MPVVRIPAPLRPQTDGRAQVEVHGATAGAALEDLARRHPGIADRVFDERGQLHRFVNVFVGDEDVRDLQGLQTPVVTGEVLALVPAVAGGSNPSVAPRRGRAATAGWTLCAERSRRHGRK